MSSNLKKISIDELQIGMFVVEMDISWIKSPFLLHRRAIKSENDIKLLRQAGVKKLSIDLSKSKIKGSEDGQEDANNIEEDSVRVADQQNTLEAEEEKHQLTIHDIHCDDIDNPKFKLEEELSRAVILKEQACESFHQINDLVKNHQAITIEELEPIVDDTITSLLRNSQALLTLMHLKRFEEKLFSHSFSVMTLALTLGIKSGLDKDELHSLGMAALLHDIGWAQLPLNLFGKIKPYTENELKVVQQHQKIANIIIGKSNTISLEVRHLMSLHHERLDGSGYPEGLKEDQLSLAARILIIADYYDESIHGLLDRPGLIASEALRQLYKEAVQNKFDKTLVETLIKLLGIYPLTSAVELTSGEKGVVVEVNRDKPLEPVVKIMYSVEGNALASPVTIDLEKDKEARKVSGIVDCLDEKNDPQHLLVVEEV